MPTAQEPERLIVFQQKGIRRQLYHGEWWYVITDVVAALTDSVDPTDYLKKLRRRDRELAVLFQAADKGGDKLTPLALIFDTAGGKQRLLAWNTEGIFRGHLRHHSE